MLIKLGKGPFRFVIGKAYLLQWRNKGLEVGRRVFHEQQPGQGIVEDGSVARVLLKEPKVITGVMLEHEVDCF